MRAQVTAILLLVAAMSASGQNPHPANSVLPHFDNGFDPPHRSSRSNGHGGGGGSRRCGISDRACTDDFTFTHGDGWTHGGAPLRVENKTQWLASVGKAPYVFAPDSVQSSSTVTSPLPTASIGQEQSRAWTGRIHRLVRTSLRATRSVAACLASHSR